LLSIINRGGHLGKKKQKTKIIDKGGIQHWHDKRVLVKLLARRAGGGSSKASDQAGDKIWGFVPT